MPVADDVAVNPGEETRNDEESSGIIDAEKILGKGWYLLNVQAHYAQPDPFVEGGQLLALYVPPKGKSDDNEDDEEDDN